MKRILFTGAGAAGAVSQIKAVRQGVPDAVITGVDASPLSSGKFFADSFYRVPMAGHSDYVGTLLDICRREHIGLVLVAVDEEMAALAPHIQMFAEFNIRLAVPPEEILEKCQDKLLSYYFFRTRVKVPETHSLDDFQPSWPGQYVLKPRRGRGSRGIIYISTQAELDFYRQKLSEPYLAQQRITGQEYTVDVLRNFQGEFLAVVPRMRLETDSGLSIKGRTVYDSGLIEATKDVVSCLGHQGAANVQWIADNTGRPHLTEVNPRLAGSVALSVAAGCNIPAELVKLYLEPGYAGSLTNFIPGTTMLRYWDAVFRPGDGQ
jgi:carbamoyl-phosphate synthase large subunit